MPVRPVRCLFSAAAIVAFALVPAAGSAQSSVNGSSNELANRCAGAVCSWSIFVNDVPIGSLRIDATSAALAELNSSMPSASSAELLAFLDDCSACKWNSRPFFVPPGILKKFGNEHLSGATDGNGPDVDGDDFDAPDASGSPRPANTGGTQPVTAVGINGNSGNNGNNSGVAVTGAANTAGPFQTPNGGVAGATSLASVVVTPEPATLVLVLTGLLGLAPVVIRARRHDRT